ncbi:hypothetical protein [Sinorhizobium medicae]|uniref:hypothetical protein n=1 Tax=Sinorhizobium medicae TaxID=110321 RepID=UPI000C7AD645|nr:hypothetical protein [Sinorhizobium medicae]MBO1962172.1 hypothetical protein [Sinorhizobium medicae]MDX0893641.1 hypothetical protein [Sinorhizobium medicae]MDX1102280.1 hypothetical protein [Sinorhizobium medicae]PLU17970.1 hypothetical protein BMJ31_21255 [Sinorhizobium medicae]PLU32966.1 hypothetical protein BMJ26_24840 [Sinorhizobium medicae]
MSQDALDKPHVSKQLVEHLEAVYSGRLSENLLTLSDRELGSKVGQRMVVDYLRGLLEQQEEENVLLVPT